DTGRRTGDPENRGHQAMKLTAKTAESLAPRAATYTAYDDALHGFGCRVTPNGARSWIAEYRARGDRNKRRVTLGPVATLSAEKARRAAQEVLAHAKLGRDLAAERSEERKAPTLAEIAARYMAEEIAPTRKPGTVKNYAKLFRLQIVPALGNRRARDVTHSEVVRLHRAIGERGKVTANRSVELVRALFNWARKAGELPRTHENPADGITRFRDEPRETFLN